MFRRQLTIALAAVAITASAAADNTDSPQGLTADKCLQSAQPYVFDIIDMNTRLDMLDYYHAGSTRPSTNVLGGECYITADSDHSIEMVGGTDITYQIFVLNPTAEYPIIGVIETLLTPIPDSRVTFYNRWWVPLKMEILPKPTLSLWLTKEGKKHQGLVEERLPFVMASYHYDPTAKRLELKNNMGQYFVSSEANEALKYTKDKLTFVWDGKKFKLEKE